MSLYLCEQREFSELQKKKKNLENRNCFLTI